MVLAQNPITPEVANKVLEATATAIVQLLAVLAFVAVVVLVYTVIKMLNNFRHTSDQQHEVLNKTIANMTEVIGRMAIIADSVTRQQITSEHTTNALDEQTLFLARIDTTTTSSLEVDKQRLAVDDATHREVLGGRTDIRNLAMDFQAGRDSAVQEVKDAMVELHNPILQKFVELAESIDARLNDTSEREDIRLLVEMMMEVRDLLKALQLPAPPPTLPSSFPTLPAKTPAMFVYETWADTTLYYESDTAPNIQWVRANSVDGVQGLQNETRVSSEIVGYQGARALKLSANPADKYPLSIGARVVLTDNKRWTALQPYAGKTLYIRYWVLWPELPVLDEQGGTAGRWCTAGFQIKDDPNTSALYQMNVDAKHKPFLTYREGAAYSQMLEFAYKPNVWTRIDLTWLMRSDSEGQLNVQIDGENAFVSEGRSAASSGFASFHFLLYTDALRAPADLLIGPVVMSTEPIP